MSKKKNEAEPVLFRRQLRNGIRTQVIKAILDQPNAFDVGTLTVEGAADDRKPYCHRTVQVSWRGRVYRGVGYSKVCYPDQWDEWTGFKIAMERAIKDLANQLIDAHYTQPFDLHAADIFVGDFWPESMGKPADDDLDDGAGGAVYMAQIFTGEQP
jgi:hypothetical protein